MRKFALDVAGSRGQRRFLSVSVSRLGLTCFVLSSLAACGGRGPLLPGEVLAVADDDEGDGDGGKPPVMTGTAGSGVGGKPNPPSSAGAGSASAGSTSNEAGQGGAEGAPLSDRDYYVDANEGDDSNPGTEQAPFKTVERALGVAVGGDTVWFEDGTWGWQNEPAFRDDRKLTVADGVELRARHAGGAHFFDQADTFDAGGLVLEGDAKLFGLQFIGFNPVLQANHGQIELEAVSFESPWAEGICNYGNHALIMLSGTAHMTMRPDQVREAFRNSFGKCLVRLDDSAVLRVEGGEVAGAEWERYPNEVAVFSTFGHSELHISDVTVRDNTLAIIGAWDDSKVSVEHTSFQGGALFEDMAPPLIHVGDRAELDVESSFFEGADLQACIVAAISQGHEEPAARVSLRDTSFSHCGIAIGLRSSSRVQLDNVSIADNAWGIGLSSGKGDGSLEVVGSRISNNQQHGVVVDAGAGTFRLSMRSSTVARNGGDGIAIGRSPALGGLLSLDLGTLAQPGANAVFANGASSADAVNLRIADDVATTLFAVGNVWSPSQQGSEGDGRYRVYDLDATVSDADHQLTGTNYAFVGEHGAQVTLRLAERSLP